MSGFDAARVPDARCRRSKLLGASGEPPPHWREFPSRDGPRPLVSVCNYVTSAHAFYLHNIAHRRRGRG